MKQTILAVLLCMAAFSTSVAADAAPTLHWFTVAMMVGNSSQNFVGSSENDGKTLAADIVAPNSYITLANLRSFGSTDGKTFKWSPSEEGKVYVMGRTILYFRELPGDPANREAQTR